MSGDIIRQRLLGEPMLRLAFVLNAWRGWLGEAVADGSARHHFEAVAAMLGGVNISPSGADSRVLLAALPPSLPAVRRGRWPVSRPVGLAICARDGALDQAAARSAVAALTSHRLGKFLRGYVVLADEIACDLLADAALLTPGGIAVPGLRQRARVVLMRKIEAELARAHALARPLAKMAALAGSGSAISTKPAQAQARARADDG